MTWSAWLGVAATFGFVMALLLVALKLLKKFAPASLSGGGPDTPMQVVQRMSLGPRQGIALVRIGDALLAVSVGEGGVRTLYEVVDTGLGAGAAGSDDAPVVAQRRPITAAGLAGDFRDALRMALTPSSARKMALVIAMCLTSATLSAQAPVQKPSVPAPITGLPGVVTRNPAAAGVTQRPTAAPVMDPASANAAARAALAAGRAPEQSVGVPTPGSPEADRMIAKLAPQMDVRVGGQGDGLRLSGTVGIIVMMGLLTLLPTLILMMTGFTRILIVLNFLKQAMGTQTSPPAHLVAGLSLLLTGFVMAPTLAEVNRTALQPWMNGQIEQADMLRTGVKPFREFMLRQTRDRDVEVFVNMSEMEPPKTPDDIPLVVLTSAFVTSELRTAFQIGFAIFLPFIVIDVVVSSVLMSMGMFMLPPAMISLPFKLLLFVLVDGWSLVVQGLVQSFR